MAKKEPRYIDGVEHWQCAGCLNWLPREAFNKHARSANGLRPYCRACQSAQDKAYYENHRASKIEYNRAYRAAHPERRERNNKYCRDWRAVNSEAVSAYQRAWRAANPKMSKDLVRAWCDANPEKVRARYLVKDAVRRGDLVRPGMCSKCNKPKPVDGHHPDYERPLDVIWLCRSCHKCRHAEINAEAKG